MSTMVDIGCRKTLSAAVVDNTTRMDAATTSTKYENEPDMQQIRAEIQNSHPFWNSSTASMPMEPAKYPGRVNIMPETSSPVKINDEREAGQEVTGRPRLNTHLSSMSAHEHPMRPVLAKADSAHSKHKQGLGSPHDSHHALLSSLHKHNLVSRTAAPVVISVAKLDSHHEKSVIDTSPEHIGNIQAPLTPSRRSSLKTINNKTFSPLSVIKPSSGNLPASVVQTEKRQQNHERSGSRPASLLSNVSVNSGTTKNSSTPLSLHARLSILSQHGSPRRESIQSQGSLFVHRENEEVARQFSKADDAGPHLTSRTNYQNRWGPITMEQWRSWNVTGYREHDSQVTESISNVPKHPNHSQSFAKIIVDLENILREALSMAGRDEGPNSMEAQPAQALVDLTTSDKLIDQSGNKQSYDPPSFENCDRTINDSPDIELIAKPHVVVQEPGREALSTPRSKIIRDMTPYPPATRHQSTVPLDVEETPVMMEERIKPQPDISHKRDVVTRDWALTKNLGPQLAPFPQAPPNTRMVSHENCRHLTKGLADQQRPPLIHPRGSSLQLSKRQALKEADHSKHESSPSSGGSDSGGVPYIADFNNDADYCPTKDKNRVSSTRPIDDQHLSSLATHQSMRRTVPPDKEIMLGRGEDTRPKVHKPDYTLKSKHHFSVREPHGFSLSRSHRRAPIARDWSNGRKRFVATVTCITTALMGLVVGIYAGEVPAIQYRLADEHHYMILGNVLFFLGLAITTFFCWPLPLLHGRKPYTMAALTILLPLQFPQALAVSTLRSPNLALYRTGVLLPRALCGLAMGFANINFKTTLLDLFGASLQSGNPHQEVVNENDVRRHGGGIGAWLGIWTWCSIMSVGVGFLIGAGIIESLSVSWGFWVTIFLNAGVLLLNVVTPEVRRSPYRRSMAEVRTQTGNGTEVSRRVARGEIKMHLESTGPKVWYEEVIAGQVLNWRMLKQPGFLVLAVYQGWIYGQIIMIIVLLGALLSRYYRFHAQHVGLGVSVMPFAALLAVPFQKASFFSRARHHKQRTDSMTFEKRITWTSHLLRRTIFMITLPFAGLAYTLSSGGPPTHYMVPIIFAGLVAFLSNLAIAECNGLIMETFDTSDLQPGMTGRPRRELPERIRAKRTNFSCFPRVSSGFAIAQTFAFLFAAGGTGCGGVVERHLGAQVATAVVASVLLILTILLFAVLWRFRTVQVIPRARYGTNILSGPEDEWKPIIIGHPSGTTRRMSVLELGRMSRWTEIRRRNRLGTM